MSDALILSLWLRSTLKSSSYSSLVPNAKKSFIYQELYILFLLEKSFIYQGLCIWVFCIVTWTLDYIAVLIVCAFIISLKKKCLSSWSNYSGYIIYSIVSSCFYSLSFHTKEGIYLSWLIYGVNTMRPFDAPSILSSSYYDEESIFSGKNFHFILWWIFSVWGTSLSLTVISFASQSQIKFIT